MSVADISIKKRIGLKLYKQYKKNATKLHKLNYIFWECTLRCNLNCLHCGSDCKKDAHVPDMPITDFIGAIDKLKDIVDPNNTMIAITGGEVLLRKDIEDAGRELYKRGFPWGIVTNGMLLSKERLNSLLNAGMRAITISLDGLNDSHNWLRNNKHSFEKVISAVKLLPQVENLKYDVVSCINTQNFDELNELKNLLIEIGIKEWRVFTIFPIGRAKVNDLLQLNPQQFKALFDFIAQTRKEGKIDMSYGCEGFLGNYEKEVRDDFFFCQAGINIASILADGSISACPNLRENYKQGNIYKDNIAEVWENKYQIFRDRSWTKTGICADCKEYEYCEGNGLHLRNEETGELAFCHLQRIEEGE
ncbi:MAG: radical SAM/SPASM domain-containing protein [Bacteroidetes bacterium]|nr:MAG: radical SAM/SPASM domain-containing protein [Bacteroidota bacterium]